jgi:hypothetical protein
MATVKEATKTEGDVEYVSPVDSTGEGTLTVVDDKGGNAADRRDMFRLGKTQELRVRLGTFLFTPFFVSFY